VIVVIAVNVACIENFGQHYQLSAALGRLNNLNFGCMEALIESSRIA
jgi:hypothetical protein